jgi:hypothetical protein
MTVLTTKTVKTKKPHECWGCGGIIPAGRTVEMQSQADGGEIFSVYTCEICKIETDRPGFNFSEMEGMGYGDLVQSIFYLESIKRFEDSSGEKWSDAVVVHESVKMMF